MAGGILQVMHDFVSARNSVQKKRRLSLSIPTVNHSFLLRQPNARTRLRLRLSLGALTYIGNNFVHHDVLHASHRA